MQLKAVFWDLDGTLIDSEPLWHDGELEIAAANNGHWTEELGWECSGTPVPDVARRMIEHGCTLSVEEIDKQLKAYVFEHEKMHMPWIDGVLDTLRSLKEAGIPTMLVSTSPRPIVENVLDAAPGLFSGYVCGDDDAKHKPSPEPYLLAAKKLGIAPENMAECAVFEDTPVGLAAGAASGATVIAQTCTIRTDTSNGPQFTSVDGYDGIDAEAIDAIVRRRLAALAAEA
ncbi:HAD family hydrolase [Bifidobacterium stellenboschense]|uniref:HAD family hydrolase n=1 Tax=Bifidobacterium stellenboschense TaxID=762211 RepID=A0A087DMT8_9BIFI|nr:HAD family phosphatase [Bifidobacterium stellenboschense]KFI96838.1 HAD family hydrolase [Bifidobacterium stellenboschense]